MPKKGTSVLVAGGGPAGSTAATLLARHGVDVTLVEADRFPRYHVGESIQPSCLPIFDMMGVRDKIEDAGFLRKYGAYFRWGPGGEEFEIDFGHLDTVDNWGYQVVRSEFDKLLLDHAESQGALVHEGTRLRSVELGEGSRAGAATWADDAGGTGRIEFDQLIDATGRSGVMSTRHLRNRTQHDVYQNIAVWGYWDGVPEFEDGPQGAVLVQSTRLGWFWVIPLHDGTTSVGLVMSKSLFVDARDDVGGIEEAYRQAVGECPLTADLLSGARRTDKPLQVDKDFCYAADRFSGPGYYLAGDAACFIDPLLTTGVHLATFSGLLAAASAGSVVRGEVPQDRATRFYDRTYRQAYERLLVLVSFLYRDFDRDAQLFAAEGLTRREQHLMGLQQGFLNVASGLEDLRDTTDASGLDEVSTRIASSGHRSTEVMGGLPTSPHQSVGGLYLVTDPVPALRDREPLAQTA